MEIRNTKIGKLGLEIDGAKLLRMEFDCEGKVSTPFKNPADAEVCNKAFKELDEYFSGKRKSFDIPIELRCTSFQKKVLNAMTRVKFGDLASYKDIAESVGSPKAFRAVGMTAKMNPIPIIIPCHRIVSASRKIGGFSLGLDLKKKLLAIENSLLKILK